VEPVALRELAEVSPLAELLAMDIRIVLLQQEPAPTARLVLGEMVALALLDAAATQAQVAVAAAADIMAAVAAVAELVAVAAHGPAVAAAEDHPMPVHLRLQVSALPMGLKPEMERSLLFIHSMAREWLQVLHHPLFVMVLV
jgi:hypothetical protein